MYFPAVVTNGPYDDGSVSSYPVYNGPSDRTSRGVVICMEEGKSKETDDEVYP
jgi:hypothetical protein